MKRKLIPLLLAAIGSSASAATGTDSQSYYDYDGPVVRSAPRSRADLPPGPKRSLIVEGDASTPSHPSRATKSGGAEEGATVASQGNQPLPPNMDRGVRDLESGMDDLKAYTTVMAAHIQQNGMRGFLAVPPDVREQGVAVGRKLGGGINGIMTDVAHEMVVPEKH